MRPGSLDHTSPPESLNRTARVGPSRSKSRASKKTPKSRLTKIRNYGLISYVSQRNSFQGRRADPAGAGAGARGTGNSPRPACGPSLSQEIAHFQEDFYRKEHKELKEKNLWSFSFALQSVRIAQFREDFFSALSATLRAPREKGKLVAACRTAFLCGKNLVGIA